MDLCNIINTAPQDDLYESLRCVSIRFTTSEKDDDIINSRRWTTKNVVMGGSGLDSYRLQQWQEVFIYLEGT